MCRRSSTRGSGAQRFVLKRPAEAMLLREPSPSRRAALWFCMTAGGVWCGALAFLSAATSSALAADRTAIQRFDLGNRGSLELLVPSSWSAVVRKRQDHSIVEITFAPSRGVPFEVSLTPSWAPNSADAAVRERELRELVGRFIDSVKGHAVESELGIVKLAGASGTGFYFSATDKSPRPADYKYLTQGVLQVEDLRINFKILTRDGQDQVVRDAISMLKSARLRAS
jgi:hypothetical protein